MLSEWNVKFLTIDDDPTGEQVGDLLISGEACVDFPDHAGAFCRSMRDLERGHAQIDVDLDIPRATAKFKILIPVKNKPIRWPPPAIDGTIETAEAQKQSEEHKKVSKPKGGRP